ncbi:uncharacterized protein [Physcomitrium patens]|nr:uncharacterized protein LOC112290984 [Physcomitrium patens]PNR61857.1 hypothetical protein PHYPA_000281 [Physcomitrium patens]|eukprot:XP_024393657.1 uncharacterized protein LOC112290984 [Physcomitrella patens]
MASRRMLVVALLGLCIVSAVAVADVKEVKPNNYPNFEFHESPVVSTADEKPNNFQSSQLDAHNEEASTKEFKPNNYPDFKFKETPVNEASPAHVDNAHDAFARNDHNSLYTVPDATYWSSRSDDQSSSHETYYGDSQFEFNVRQGTQEVSSFENTPSTKAVFKTVLPEYKGSDVSNRYPSSYEMINGRNQETNSGRFNPFASNEVRFTNVHKTQVPGEDHASGSEHSERSGSSQFYSPSSDPDFAFRFAKPESTTPSSFGDNKFQADNQADENVYSQFQFDNSEATNDPTATYGRTTPVLAAGNAKQLVAGGGHGCSHMYWAEHTKQWPSFFNVNTQVAQAFGTKAGEVYGTTTLFQALYDNRSDGYSQLLSHGTAALLNSYIMPNYGDRHDAVIDQFLGALASRTAAGVQAQKFLNKNHAYGPNECMN